MKSTPHEFQLDQYMMHHVLDSQEWKLPFLPAIQIPEFASLHAIIMLLVAAILIFVGCVLYKKDQRVPKGMTNVLELVVVFVRDQIARPALGEKDGNKFTPILCTFFTFILMMNLIGMIPLFATATANINVTGALAFIILGFMTVGAIVRNGIHGFIHAIKPSGVPIPILFLIVPLEFVGIFIKAFALMIRLFANMLAGHMVILSLLGLVVLIGYAALPAVVLAVGISILEVLVAFLQAFIFTLLSAVFIGQMYHPEH